MEKAKKILLFGLLVVFLLPNNALTGEILLVVSYHPSNEWTANCIKGIRQQIADRHSIEIIAMDTKRKKESEFQTIADSVWARIIDKKPDLVMLADDNALKYLGPRLSQSDMPVVFYGVNNTPRSNLPNGRIPENMTGLMEKRLLIPLARTVIRIVPANHNRILILFDDSETTKIHLEKALFGKKTIPLKNSTIEWKSIGYYDIWQETVLDADNHYDAIIMENWYTVKDRHTKTVMPEQDVLEWTAQNAPVPIFGTTPFAVGRKRLVGALVLEGTEYGQAAAEIALQILDSGMKPSEFTITYSEKGKYYFNEQKLTQFNLQLPAEIRNVASFN